MFYNIFVDLFWILVFCILRYNLKINIMELHTNYENSHVRVELGINAQRFIQQVQINNQSIEEQIAKGIELAINDISDGDNFVQAIRESTKTELENIVNKIVMSYDIRSKISKVVASKIEDKIGDYADKIADKIATNLE